MNWQALVLGLIGAVFSGTAIWLTFELSPRLRCWWIGSHDFAAPAGLYNGNVEWKCKRCGHLYETDIKPASRGAVR